MWFDWFFCFLVNTLRSWDLFHFTILLRISTYIKRTSRRINRFLHNIDRHYPRRIKNESSNEWTRFLWSSPQSWNNMENSFSTYRIPRNCLKQSSRKSHRYYDRRIHLSPSRLLSVLWVCQPNWLLMDDPKADQEKRRKKCATRSKMKQRRWILLNTLDEWIEGVATDENCEGKT